MVLINHTQQVGARVVQGKGDRSRHVVIRILVPVWVQLAHRGEVSAMDASVRDADRVVPQAARHLHEPLRRGHSGEQHAVQISDDFILLGPWHQQEAPHQVEMRPE